MKAKMKAKTEAKTKKRKQILALSLAALLAIALFASCGGAGGGSGATTTAQAATTTAAATETTTAATTAQAATAAAQANGGAATDTRLDKILSAGEIVVATSPDFAPMEFIDDRKSGQDQYVGTDPWFAKYIADELGVKLKIEAMDFGALQAAISTGSVDLAMSGLARTDERAESLELSTFYNITTDNGQGLLVLKSTLDQYQTADDFKGKTVAVQSASLQYNLLTEQLPDAIPELVTNINDGVMMLLSNKVDAVGVAGTNGLTIIENYSDLAMAGWKYDYKSQGNVIAMTKGETSLCARINEIIEKANSEDKFNTWLKEGEALAKEIGWEN
ncbi:MAG: transporter substrate-binding domain-containing protein [Clostridiales bacterium]|jgi:polar amino acid transport system substrate-binding protein|nr:transporter substrate-binding domain-containing protein [Clostridiales bacterium]